MVSRGMPDVRSMSRRKRLRAGGAYVAMKFVLRLDGPASEVDWSRSSVPPTICLTTPWCRSIHGRNWERRRGGEVEEEVGGMDISFVEPGNLRERLVEGKGSLVRAIVK